MRREHSVPLVLWLCAALCLHFVGGGAGYVRAKLDEDLDFFSAMGNGVPSASGPSDLTIDIAPDEATIEAEKAKTPKEKEKTPEKKPEAKVAKKDEEKPKEAVPVDPAKLEAKKKRQAVIQNHPVEEKDNPDARFEAEQAHRTEEETVAQIRNRQRDDKDPTPGGRHSSASSNPGNADDTKIAENENRAGSPSRSSVGAQAGKAAHAAPTESKPAGVAGGGQGQVAPGAKASGSEATGESGWTLNLGPSGSSGKAAANGQVPGAAGTGSSPWLGLGAKPMPGQINLNLSHEGVVGSVGEEALARDRQAEAEERRSKIAGAWQAAGLERWRSAIENYVADVKPGNQTSLNAAHSPFAAYIVKMHNRIHPLFAESFIGSIRGLPANNPISDTNIYTVVEVALSPEDGKLLKAGVVHHSGVTAFDLGALDSIGRAAPFGKAPKEIVSYNGRVYLHWTFRRNENYCHHGAAAPFLLAPPKDPGSSAHSENEVRTGTSGS